MYDKAQADFCKFHFPLNSYVNTERELRMGVLPFIYRIILHKPRLLTSFDKVKHKETNVSNRGLKIEQNTNCGGKTRQPWHLILPTHVESECFRLQPYTAIWLDSLNMTGLIRTAIHQNWELHFCRPTTQKNVCSFKSSPHNGVMCLMSGSKVTPPECHWTWGCTKGLFFESVQSSFLARNHSRFLLPLLSLFFYFHLVLHTFPDFILSGRQKREGWAKHLADRTRRRFDL